MADAAQRQRKLAMKAARRKSAAAERKKLETTSSSLAARVRVASRGPIVRCAVSSSLFEDGIGQVLIARMLPSGLLGCAFFLVDVHCLGVKDAAYRELGLSELRAQLALQEEVQRLSDVEPAYARKLVRDSAAYAGGFGLAAAKDTPVVEAIFGDVDASRCTEVFTFGQDGKPLFVPGPFDTAARVRAVTKALGERLRPDEWDFIVEVPAADMHVTD